MARHGSSAPRRAPEANHLFDRGECDHLGLGPRHQHASVDEQVEPEELPTTEHVLQRFAAEAPLDHVVEVRDRGRGGGLVLAQHQFDPVVSGDPLDQPAGLGIG